MEPAHDILSRSPTCLLCVAALLGTYDDGSSLLSSNSQREARQKLPLFAAAAHLCISGSSDSEELQLLTYLHDRWRGGGCPSTASIVSSPSLLLAQKQRVSSGNWASLMPWLLAGFFPEANEQWEATCVCHLPLYGGQGGRDNMATGQRESICFLLYTGKRSHCSNALGHNLKKAATY